MEKNFKLSRRLLNPRQDTIFKAMFCQNTTESRAALKSFLESVIGKKIDSIQMRPNEFALLLDGEKNPRLDLSVMFNDAEQASIEMQSYIPDYDYKNRALYYLLKQASSTLKAGDSYDELYSTYQISVLEFNYLPSVNSIHWAQMCELPEDELPAQIKSISRNSFTTPKSYRKFSDKLNIIFIELPDAEKLLKKDINLLSDLEKWYIFLLYADKKDKQGIISEISKTTEGIRMAEEALSNISMDYWDKLDEISREKWEHDRLSNRLAREKKLKEATEKARQEAMKEGLQQGIQQEKYETARKMLELKKMTIEDIALCSGLPKEKVQELQMSL
jgi:predicted transposase/invertase (TIGR01784 family)